MIDYRVEVRNGNLVITKIRGKIASYIYGYEAYKTLMRIVDMPDIRKIKKAIKYRNYDETTLDDMRLLLKNKYNITIKDDKAVFDIMYKYYRQNLPTQKTITAIAAIGIATGIGIAALVKMFGSAGKELTQDDLTTYTSVSVDDILIGKPITNTDSIIVPPQQPISYPIEGTTLEYTKPTKKEEITEGPVAKTPPSVERIMLTEEDIQSLINNNNKELNENDVKDVVDNYTRGQLLVQGNVDTEILENLKAYDEILPDVEQETGVNVALLRDILSQETSGGKSQNPGQIVFSSWDEEPIDVYNFNQDRMIKLVFSNDKAKWDGKVDRIITKADLLNPRTNCIVMGYIIQYYARKFGNMGWTIQSYNNGETYVSNTLNIISKSRNMTLEEIAKLDPKITADFIHDFVGEDAPDPRYFFNVIKHLSIIENVNGIKAEYVIRIDPTKELREQYTVTPDMKFKEEQSQGVAR